jgi:Fe-S-cluster-containing hydrogenase component 2
VDEECSGCGQCAMICISGAIQMTTYVDRALERYVRVQGGPYPSRFKRKGQSGVESLQTGEAG